MDDDLGFDYLAQRTQVVITRRGRVVTTLRGREAERFLTRIASLEGADAQRHMARITGQYKMGNERRGR
ncbi:MAG: hypothetical protein AAF513_05530 [Pseudomonadota bacterium]